MNTAPTAPSAPARVAQVAPGWLASGWGRLKVLAQGCWAFLVGVAGTSWQARQPLLLALGVGSVIGLGCYLAGPLVAREDRSRWR